MDYLSINYFEDLEFVRHGEKAATLERFSREDFKDYWGIQFTRRGRLYLKIGDQPTEYASGAAVFITFPGVRFLFGAADDDGLENKVHVCFRGARVQRYLEGGLLAERRNNALLTPANPDEFLGRLRRLRTLITLGSTGSHARAVLELENLLLELREGEQEPVRRENLHYPEFAVLAEHIVISPGQDWDFVHEAKKLSVSYAHFRRLFERFFNTPPGAFLLSARLDKAAELLLGSTLSIREIAHECGFEDEFYFSRSFKRHRGASPKFYRDCNAPLLSRAALRRIGQK